MTDDEILAAFQKTVRRLDNWRGYFGDDEESPTDDEVHEALQRARHALGEVKVLERQRDAVLALCDATAGPFSVEWISGDKVREIYHPVADPVTEAIANALRKTRLDDGEYDQADYVLEALRELDPATVAAALEAK